MNEEELKQFWSIMADVKDEVSRAKSKYPKFNSLHEGYAILLEEIEELWDHTKVKQANRNGAEIEIELMQVIAMAVRCMLDLGPEYKK